MWSRAPFDLFVPAMRSLSVMAMAIGSPANSRLDERESGRAGGARERERERESILRNWLDFP